jgi:hypothetical protein
MRDAYSDSYQGTAPDPRLPRATRSNHSKPGQLQGPWSSSASPTETRYFGCQIQRARPETVILASVMRQLSFGHRHGGGRPAADRCSISGRAQHGSGASPAERRAARAGRRGARPSYDTKRGCHRTRTKKPSRAERLFPRFKRILAVGHDGLPTEKLDPGLFRNGMGGVFFRSRPSRQMHDAREWCRFGKQPFGTQRRPWEVGRQLNQGAMSSGT